MVPGGPSWRTLLVHDDPMALKFGCPTILQMSYIFFFNFLDAPQLGIRVMLLY
jgi:hypothetical protein